MINNNINHIPSVVTEVLNLPQSREGDFAKKST